MKNHFSIPPSIEKRLQVWTDWAERQTQRKQVSKPCITISREYGCQAYILAEALYHRLNEDTDKSEEWAMLDRYLLEKIAHQAGYSKSELNYLTQTNPTTFQAFFANLMGTKSARPDKAFHSTKETIEYFAKAGNSIIIGRGGACITQGFPNVLHVRLVAPLGFKVRHIMNSMNLSEDEAGVLIKARQGERDAFIKHFTKMDISDPELYHLILNNEKSSINELADVVLARLQSL